MFGPIYNGIDDTEKDLGTGSGGSGTGGGSGNPTICPAEGSRYPLARSKWK